MYTIIAIFYASLIGIIVMILLKRREVKTGHPSIVSRMGQGSDHVFHAFFSGIHQGLSYINKHTFIALAQWMAFRALVPVRKVYIEVKHKALTNPHSKKVVDAVRGRSAVTPHGASFYLRKIAKEEEK